MVTTTRFSEGNQNHRPNRNGQEKHGVVQPMLRITFGHNNDKRNPQDGKDRSQAGPKRFFFPVHRSNTIVLLNANQGIKKVPLPLSQQKGL